MKTLKQHFEELLKEPKKWKYYNDLEIDGKLENILNKPESFITAYLNAGNKLLPEINNIIRMLSKKRLQHTVSIFLLGLVFYNENDKIKFEINKYLDTTRNEIQFQDFNIKYNFTYWWFLICFIHDIGYAYNKNNQKLKLFDTKDSNVIESKVKEELTKIDKYAKNSVPEKIENNWEKYLEYRKNEENNKIEHGILGGAYYIYTLDNITKKKLQNEFKIDEKGLFWSKDWLDKVHKPIAWIIVAHNIWYKNENCDNIKEYKDNNLHNLIINEPIIELSKYPLYFLLCLVDSLDPVKFLMTKDETEVLTLLKNTYFELNEKNEMRIEFRNEYKKYNNCYKNVISSIANWLCINCNQYIDFNKIGGEQ